LHDIKLKKFLFENHSIRQTVLKNTIWVTIAQGGSGVLRLALIIYAIRTIGVAEWGIFSYALGITGILALFSDIGMTNFVMREMSKSPVEGKKYFAAAFFTKIGLYAVGIILILLGTQFLSLEISVSRLLPFLLIVMVLDGLRDLTNVLARSSEKMEIEAFVNIGTSFLQMLAGIVLLALIPSSKALAIAYLVGSGIGLIALSMLYKTHFRGLVGLFRPSLIKPMIAHSWPLGLATFTGTIMINTDIIMIGYLKTAHEVGIYAAAYRFVQIGTMALGLVVVPLIPIMARFADDTARFANLIKKCIQGALLLAIPIMVGGAAAAPTIVAFLFGDAYLSATPVLRILILTIVVSFPSIIIATALYAQKKDRYLIIYSVVGMSANVLFNLLLIPSFGIMGVSYSTLTVQTILFFFLLSVFERMSLSELAKILWKTTTASLTMGLYILIAQSVGLPAVVLLGGAALVFGSAIILLKEKSLQEIKSAFAV